MRHTGKVKAFAVTKVINIIYTCSYLSETRCVTLNAVSYYHKMQHQFNDSVINDI